VQNEEYVFVYQLSTEIRKRLALRIQGFMNQVRAQHVFLVDQDGHVLVHEGIQAELDVSSAAALLASMAAASGGLAREIHTEQFHEMIFEGTDTDIFAIRVAPHFIFGVIFQRKYSTIGLIRLKAQKLSHHLEKDLHKVLSQSQGRADILSEMSDDVLDQLLQEII
jgi:predicted regulator of Ras-like GTPase activity (Roadblock/LC7/MglB family)